MNRFIFKNLNDVEIKEEYQVKISNSFAAFQYWDDNAHTGRV
jgi:hypothetical protein